MSKREFRFRVWDTENNNWVEAIALTIHTSGRLLNVPESWLLMQWTGQVDKNGHEIYEGDLCRLDGAVYEVYWNEDRWGLLGAPRPAGGTLRLDYDNGDYYRGDDINNWPEFEVIGNIYEHPQLLEQPS